MTLALVNVSGATNASPIVVTTSTPHGLVQPVGGAKVVRVDGVLGNTAANGVWTTNVLSTTTLELLGSTGNGAYSGGGTLLGPLPQVNALVGLFSQEVIWRLAARGMSPLKEGRILLGEVHQMEQTAPPRILFVPTTNEFSEGGAPEMGGVANKTNLRNSVERRAQLAQRPIASDHQHFEVRVWGAADVVAGLDPTMQKELDIGATQDLLDVLIVSLFKTAVGTFEISKGRWTQSKKLETQNMNLGLEYVFDLKVRRPVLDDAYGFAPAGVRNSNTTNMQTPSGSSSQGCTS